MTVMIIITCFWILMEAEAQRLIPIRPLFPVPVELDSFEFLYR